MILNTNEAQAWWLEQMLDQRNMVTSYKAYWMMGILDIITESNADLVSFEAVVERMIVNAWYPTVTCKLSFGLQDRLSSLVAYLSLAYPKTNVMTSTKLLTFLQSPMLGADKHYLKKRNELYQMVPYRLLSPFFKEATRGIKDQKKNRLIKELTSSSHCVFYDFVEKDKLLIRQEWMTYIKDNQIIIKAWLKYKLIMYLQARNPNVPNIPQKLAPPSLRKLTDAKHFWKHMSDRDPIVDIYTKKTLRESNYSVHGGLSIDHFIPWSFVCHDEFWNLSPTFKNVNSSKNNSLPSLQNYLQDFCRIQHYAINKLKTYRGGHKLLEEYYSISDHMASLINSSEYIEQDQVHKHISNGIMPIYQIAKNQGYMDWKY